MTHYVFHDAVGRLTGGMSTDDQSLPERQGQPFLAVEALPDDLSAWVIVDGALVASTDITEADRSTAMARVNDMVGRARALFITTAPGQDMTYLAKQAEAAAYLSSTPPPADLSAFPFIAAEIGITGADAAAVAGVFFAKAAEWASLGASFERLRMTASAAISAASDRTTLEAASSAFSTDLTATLAAADASL